MKFGVRECADVVFRAKTAQKIGKKIFYKNEPVVYFDTLKTSSLEGAATTVYAQGGRGNPRLMSWDGERTVTFTMEDALISPVGLAILSGAGLIDAEDLNKGVIQHLIEQTDKTDGTYVYVKEEPYKEDGQESIYVMKLNSHGEVDSEPILFNYNGTGAESSGTYAGYFKLEKATASKVKTTDAYTTDSSVALLANETILVDYYTSHKSKSMEINITPDKFGGAFYMEASTLWRDQGTQKDYPAEFIIPNLRVQSNFTFTMASSGDPSSFTFTCDAFPDYTRFDKTKKVLAQIQIIGASTEEDKELYRISTRSGDGYDSTNDLVYRGNEVSAVIDVSNLTVNDTLSAASLFTITAGEGWTAGTPSYTSSNTTAASISSGTITANAAGLTKITASVTFTTTNETSVTKTASTIIEVVAAAEG